jgi:hypothetical protein
MKSNTYYDNLFRKILTEKLEDRADELVEKLKFNKPGSSFDYVEEGETCECGGEMREGECMECGKGYMTEGETCECGGEMREGECMECGMRESEIMEKLYGRQNKLDKNKNGKIDSEDFKILRRKKESKEGNAFTGMLKKTPKGGKFELGGKTYTDKSDLDESVLYRLEYINESALFTEDEIIDIIEGIIKEENKIKDNIKKGKTPAGYVAYEKSHKGSKKEEGDYMKSFEKKMKDYLKDGSKGKFDMNPKQFPMGNGEIEKMEKMAYVPSNAVQDYVDNFTAAALENLDFNDGITPNENWMTDNIEGSSRTGNNPEWANAVETPTNKKRNKIRKDNLLGKLKRKAYNKSVQPVVSDKSGNETDKASKIMMKLESTENKKIEKLNEEFDRMRKLIGYQDKTQ